MTAEKELALDQTYQKFIQAIIYDLPLDQAEQVFAEGIMGYGTGIDEKMLSVADCVNLIKLQREQAAGMQMQVAFNPVSRRVFSGGDSAVFVDEITISMIVEGGNHRLFVRMSTVLEYTEGKWHAVHFHASRPVESEGDTWHVNEWKQKNEALERLVAEKTADLEGKNRELVVEGCLERVRSQAMAMSHPADMLEVCRTISEQLQLLQVKDIRNIQTAIIDEPKHIYLNYEYFAPYDKTWISEADYTLHPKVSEFVNEIRKSADAFFTTSFEGEALKEWREYRRQTDQVPDPTLDGATSLHYYFYSIGPGALGVSTYAPLRDEDIAVFKRFRNVFGLAYRRFMDIQQAEAQAREARIEASLERVRAEALGMKKPGDLLGICEVLYAELLALGFNELRNAMINIFNDEKGSLLNYDFSTDVGKTINVLPYDIHPVIEHQLKQIRSSPDAFSETVFTGKDLEDWKDFRRKSGEPDDPRVKNITSLHYYLYSIGSGSIGISTFSPIAAEKRDLLKRFRNVFDLAYRRYSDVAQAEIDLQRLKEEKQRAESALSDLKATQAQLVQAEKMASLGELTAGIAHEIQNPLNFVNNFSEVSNEMIDEMKTELASGNSTEAVAIAEEVKQNLVKIAHHGKRADAIVKGMLQHSRASAGVKEPTDINALADEYLRLAYHGLRAKDKSFQAAFRSDLDDRLGKISVIPQDIGRVFLNLINNAFYAVVEKKKLAGEKYEPTVGVTTRQLDGRIEIRVRDNGTGVPPGILEKIFQPFFTTKPTGQGTGLGLSLSYDIIKAHRGELRVETKEGDFTEFIVHLPVKA